MRLTNDIRNTVIKNALDHRFAEDDAKHAQARTDFALALYNHEFPPQEIATVKPLGERWYEQTRDFEVQHVDFGYVNPSNPKVEREDSSFTLPEPAIWPRGFYRIEVPERHDMYEAARTLARAGQKNRRAREKAREQLRALVDTFSTDTKLFEVWPEGRQFLPDAAPAPSKAMVPAQLVTRVNALLGLEVQA